MNINLDMVLEITINAICACGSEAETAEHFLRCHLYSPQRLELFGNIEKVNWSFLNLNIKDKVSILLYGSQSATFKCSYHEILKFVINYTKETGCFDRPLFCPNQWFLTFFRYVATDSHQLKF